LSTHAGSLSHAREKLNNIFSVNHFFLAVPLGSIPELPAQSCKEIKASEEQAVSDTETEGEFYNSKFY